MDTKNFVKQVFDFQKNLADSTYLSLDTMQKQGEKLTKTIFEALPHIPEQSKAFFNDYLANIKQGQKQLRDFHNQSFDNVERFIFQTR